MRPLDTSNHERRDKAVLIEKLMSGWTFSHQLTVIRKVAKRDIDRIFLEEDLTDEELDKLLEAVKRGA